MLEWILAIFTAIMFSSTRCFNQSWLYELMVDDPFYIMENEDENFRRNTLNHNHLTRQMLVCKVQNKRPSR